MGLALVLAGLLVWLLAGQLILGVVLIVVGVVLLGVPPGAAGPRYYRRWPW